VIDHVVGMSPSAAIVILSGAKNLIGRNRALHKDEILRLRLRMT
jgi:hypothetical protein